MSSRPPPLDAGAFERELDTEEYSVLRAPSSLSSTAAVSGASVAAAARGESGITPSAARASSTRVFGGGLDDEGQEQEDSCTPIIKGRGTLVLISKEDMGVLCCGFVGRSRERFCGAARLEGKKHCGMRSHERAKMVVSEDTYFVSGGVVNDRPLVKADPFVRAQAIPEALTTRFVLGVEDTIQNWVSLIVDATVAVSSDDSFSAFLEQAHADLDEAAKDLDEQEQGEEDTKPAVKSEPEEVHMTAKELFDPSSGEDAGSMDISSISSLGLEEDEFGLADDEWTIEAEDLEEAKSWVPTAREHRAAIEKTGAAVRKMGDAFPSVIKMVDVDLRQTVNQIRAGFNLLKERVSGVEGALGTDLPNILAGKSLGEVLGSGIPYAITECGGDIAGILLHLLEEARRIGGLELDIEGVSSEVAGVRSDLNVDSKRVRKAVTDIQAEVADRKSGDDTLFRVLQKISRNNNTKHSLISERITSLEASRLRVDPSSMGGGGAFGVGGQSEDELINGILNQNGNGPAGGTYGGLPYNPRGFDARSPTKTYVDDVRGRSDGSPGDEMLPALESRVGTLEAKLEVQLDRSKGQGIIFGELAFPSEADFFHWFTPLNSTGRGMAAFVDINTIWVFASLEQVTTADWLQMQQRSMASGYTNMLETQYASAMTNRYPTSLVGAVKGVLPRDTIEAFKSLEGWRGNGMGDGNKERLLVALRQGVDRHRVYCMDNLPPGPYREHALRSGQATSDWYQSFFSFCDDELNMLASVRLSEDKFLTLVSQETVSIFDEAYEFHQQAINVDPSNKAMTAGRYAWVTLQTLGLMEEYKKARFRNHPSIAGTFIRFLVRQTAQGLEAGLKGTLQTLEQSVRRLEKGPKKADFDRLESKLDKLESKLDAVVKANNLKTKQG